jgi:CRISPR-associated endonuclease/helicase Cas3
VLEKSYYKYWGKAKKKEIGEGYDYHLLPYHCLDVAAVGRVWLEQDSALCERIAFAIGADKSNLFDTIGFFFSLHDLGKFDIRFQSKVPEIRDEIWKELNKNDLFLTTAQISEFDHGKAGYEAFIKHFPQLLDIEGIDDDLHDKWKPWIAAVTGHHGVIPQNADWHNPSVESIVFEHERQVRKEWFKTMLSLFDISIINIPILSEKPQSFIAGFCSVSDWIASNELFVRWYKDIIPPDQYYKEAVEHCRQIDILRQFGIVGCQAAVYKSVNALLPENTSPRQIQTLIDILPVETGLTIIEGTTGSGKTEAALALAWKLIDSGQADSIVFALPT